VNSGAGGQTDAWLSARDRHARAARRGPEVNLVDSSAWLEYFADGPNASFFESAITRKAELIVPTIVIFEVGKRVLQQRSEEEALRAISVLHTGAVIPHSAELAVRAAGRRPWAKMTNGR